MYVHADTSHARVLARARARARHESERGTVDKGVQKNEDSGMCREKGKSEEDRRDTRREMPERARRSVGLSSGCLGAAACTYFSI